MEAKLITLKEFEALVRAKLKHNWEREINSHMTGNLLGYLISSGFPKLDVNNFGTFLQQLKLCITFDLMAVNINDDTFYYLISDTGSQLIKKSDVQVKA